MPAAPPGVTITRRPGATMPRWRRSPASASTTSSTRAPARTGSRRSRSCSPPAACWTSCSAARRIDRAVAVDVGRDPLRPDPLRRHDAARSAADGYARIPADGELRDGDRVAIVGAAGPMGFMHVIRAATLGPAGDLHVAAIDIDDARLAHLADVAAPLAAENGVEATFQNSRVTPPAEGRVRYVGVMVPAPALVVQAVAMAAPGARLNLFAGFAVGTRASLDLNARHRRGALPVRHQRVRDPGHGRGARATGGRPAGHERLARRGLRDGGGRRRRSRPSRRARPAARSWSTPRSTTWAWSASSELPERFPPRSRRSWTDGRWNARAEAALLAAAAVRPVRVARLHGPGDVRLSDEPVPVAGPRRGPGAGHRGGHLRLRPPLVRGVRDRRCGAGAAARPRPRGGRRHRRAGRGPASGWRSTRTSRAAAATRAPAACRTCARASGSSATAPPTAPCAS